MKDHIEAMLNKKHKLIQFDQIWIIAQGNFILTTDHQRS